jgi:hypothetical protein
VSLQSADCYHAAAFTMRNSSSSQFEVPLSAEEQREEVERQKRKVMEAAEQHVSADPREGRGQAGGRAELLEQCPRH